MANATADRRIPSLTIIAVLLAALALGSAPAGGANGRVAYTHPASAAAWTPLGIEIVLTGGLSAAEIAAADVIVERSDGSRLEIPLSVSSDLLFGEIPGVLVSPPELSYYLRVIYLDGSIETAPPGAQGSGRFRIPVIERGAPVIEDATPVDPGRPTEPNGIEIVTPAAGELVAETPEHIAAVFTPPLEAPWSVLVLLDGDDVSEASTLSADLVLVEIDEPLSRGPHRVTISALTASRAMEQSWVFFVGDAMAEVPGLPDARDDWPAWETSIGSGVLDQGEDPGAWRTIGRIEVGWATVSADTVAADSLDVTLPYNEVSDPTLDLYASGFRSDAGYTLTAQYDPVYSSELEWQAGFATGMFEVEAGHIYPSLSRTTLDWTAGLGARAAASPGRGHGEIVALRVSESDTVGGFGFYSRYALGGSGGFDWSDRIGVSLAHVSIFDDEDTVPAEDRITDPLTNHVTACVVRGRTGDYAGELEVAVSSAEGETDGSGVAARAEIIRGTELDDHISLELSTSETGFYSAGSLQQQPGESALRLSGAWSVNERARTSGWVLLSRDTGSIDLAATDELTVNTYARTDVTWALDGADLRSFVVARYDRSPGVDDDYTYGYASLGTTWRVGRTRAVASASWSRSDASARTDLWTLGVDVRHSPTGSGWSARAAGRWTTGSGDETDSTRSQYTFEATSRAGEAELRLSYWLIERDDRAKPEQSYTIHVLRAGLAYAF